MFERILITPRWLYRFHALQIKLLLKIQEQRFTNGLHTRCSQKFCKFHWKNTCAGVFFKKASGPQACKCIKKILQHRYFPVKLIRFSRALFLQNTSGGSFLKQATVTFCSKISQGYLLRLTKLL